MIKLLKKLTKKDMALAGLAFLLILAQVYLNLTMPDYMSDMTVLVQTEGSAMADILAAGGKMLLCAVGSLLTAACIAVCAAKISANFSANLRGQVFNRVQSFSMEEIGRFSTSSLITRSTNDITQVQMVLVLGLDGSPQAGDKFIVMDDEKEAKQIAARRMQLKREQTVRASKHITLDEIGRRIAIGDFKELNIIVKGDVDGSVEALTEALERLSTDKIHINIIHHAVGAVTESDVLLASASEAIIIGFNVRPTANARRLSEQEQIEIRTYSIIYDAINEVKDAMEGMLAPEYKEEIVANLEVRQVYHISKVGTIAGCMVLDGKLTRNTKVRVVRDGVVVFTGEIESLKRFKDDVKEVSKGFECGLSIAKFNDIQEGDQIEGYQMVEVKPKL